MNITLNEEQSEALIGFFKANDAAGHIQQLLDVFEGYLISSNEERGIIAPDVLTENFYEIRMVIRLINAIEIQNAFNLKKVS